VHAHYATHPATVAFIISSLAPITFSVTAHAHDLFVAWRRPLLAAMLRRTRFVRVISEFNRSFVIGLHPWSAERIKVIHVGVDPDMYGGGAPEERDDEAVPRLLCVAALQPYKGLTVLIEACRRLRDAGRPFHCDIVGDGVLRPALEDAIADARLGDRVRLHGALRQDEVAALVRRAAIVVLPSVVAPDGQMDGIPVALMEAMASGLCVVSGDLVSIRELVVHEKTGLMVTPGDVDEFAEAIGSLIADPELAGRLSSQGCAWVRHEFSMETNVERLMAAFGIPVTSSVGDEVRPFVMEEAVEETVEAAVEEVDEEADEVRDEEADDEADEFDGWRRSA
jgi:glycosyltransferase involved in cell wall biosynthesis